VRGCWHAGLRKSRSPAESLKVGQVLPSSPVRTTPVPPNSYLCEIQLAVRPNAAAQCPDQRSAIGAGLGRVDLNKRHPSAQTGTCPINHQGFVRLIGRTD
jgi:hypothetical protein